MDANGFDTLARSLTTAGSRRGALAGFLGSALGLVGFPTDEAVAHDLLSKCKKIKDKAKRKKCLKKARAHNATHLTEMPPPPPPPPDVTCTPSCGGRNCGLDGCGGLCGPCNDGTCTDGICVCRSGEELCQGKCVSACAGGMMRVPGSCSCCTLHGPCTPGPCCGRCASDVCVELREGEFCNFDAPCQSDICTNGFCRCPSDKEACAGSCFDPCPPDQIRNANTCNCCIPDRASCASTSPPCCSGICQQGTNVCRSVSDL